jgi:hypothetical protein
MLTNTVLAGLEVLMAVAVRNIVFWAVNTL